MKRKVFGVGFQKTGTSSFGRAMEILGYRVHDGGSVNKPGKPWIDPPISKAKLVDAFIPLARNYDAVRDNPWCLLYRELDAVYPGSKFVLTRREPGAWLRSVQRHFGRRVSPLMGFIYDGRPPDGNEAVYLAAYRAHNEGVLNYFKDRPDDLLVLDLEAVGWRPLCTFLGCRGPWFQTYPHRNTAEQRDARRARKARRARGVNPRGIASAP